MHNDIRFEWTQGCARSCMEKVLDEHAIPYGTDEYHNLTAALYSSKKVPVEYYQIKDTTFGIITKAQWRAIKPIREAGVNEVFIRPTYRGFGVYHTIGINRAEVLFEGTEDECRDAVSLTRFWGDKEVDY